MAVAGDPRDLRVALEDPDVEVGGLFGLAVKPQAGGNLVDGGHGELLGVVEIVLVAGTVG
jgi:hypothetical protein